MAISNITNESFLNHTPGPEDITRMQALRAEHLKTFDLIQQIVPDCAEKTLAIRNLEQALMWANKAIILHPVNPDETKVDTKPLIDAFGDAAFGGPQ